MRLGEIMAGPVGRVVLGVLGAGVMAWAGLASGTHQTEVRERAAAAESVRVVRVEVDRGHARCDSLAALLAECRTSHVHRATRGQGTTRLSPRCGARNPVERAGFWSRNGHWIIPVAALGVGGLIGHALSASDVIQTTIVSVSGGTPEGPGHGRPTPPKHPKPRKCR